METDRALEALIASPKYRGVYRGAVERVYREMLRRHRPRDAEKAARAELHRITGAFLTPNDLKKARALLQDYVSGDRDALTRVLALHASTRERLDVMAELRPGAAGAWKPQDGPRPRLRAQPALPGRSGPCGARH